MCYTSKFFICQWPPELVIIIITVKKRNVLQKISWNNYIHFFLYPFLMHKMLLISSTHIWLQQNLPTFFPFCYVLSKNYSHILVKFVLLVQLTQTIFSIAKMKFIFSCVKLNIGKWKVLFILIRVSKQNYL